MNEVPPIIDVARRKHHTNFKYPIVILLLLVLSPIGLFIAAPSWHVYKADAGFRRAKRTIDPEQLRVWAIQEIARYPLTNNQTLHFIPQSEIPRQLQSLDTYRPEAAIIKDRSAEIPIPYVKIVWGGGFFTGDSSYKKPIG